MRTTRLMIVLGLLLFASQSYAQSGRLDQIKTSHYRLSTDLDKETAKDVAKHMDAVFEEYERRLSGFGVRNSRPMTLHVFRTQEKYLNYLNGKDVNGTNTGGIFFVKDSSAGLAAWVGAQGRDRMFQVLQHEGFHQFAYLRIGANIPVWVNEGLAEYFGESIMVRGRFKSGLVEASRLERVVNAIEDDEWFGFEKLFTMSGSQWNNRLATGDPLASLQYDQSWSIVHFLIHAKNGKYEDLLMDFLRKSAQGMDRRRAMEETFGDDIEPFEKAWKEYMLALEPDALSTLRLRLEFMAYALKKLHENDVKVESVDQLKSILRMNHFTYTRMQGGQRIVLDAADDENFQVPRDKSSSRKATIEIVNGQGADLPPQIRVKGFRPEVSVQWRADDEGQIAPEFVYR